MADQRTGISQPAPRRWRWPLGGWLLAVGWIGCNGAAVLHTVGPPEAPISLMDPTSVVVRDSIVNVDVLLDLQPAVDRMMGAAEPGASVDEEASAGPDDGGADAPSEGDDAEPEEDSAQAAADTGAERADDSGPPEGGTGGASPADDDGEEAWLELARGVRAQVRVRPEDVRVEILDALPDAEAPEPMEGEDAEPPPSDPVVVVEADLRVGLLAEVGAKGTQRTCGCDGEAWCGEAQTAPLRVTARWVTTLSLLPDWHLQPDTTFEVSEVGRCSLGRGPDGRWLQAADFLQEQVEATVAQMAGTLDQALAELDDVRDAVTRVWTGLDDAAALDARQAELLWLRPRAIKPSPMEVRDGRVVVPLRFAMRPLLMPADARREVTALPEASQDEIVHEGVRLGMSLVLPLEDASAQLQRKLGGKRFSAHMTRHVTIESASVRGAPEGPVVRLDVTGSARGALFLNGRLVLDPQTRVATLEELDFDQQSTEALHNLYDVMELPNLNLQRVAWVDPDAIRAEVRQAVGWSFDSSMEGLRAQVERALQRALVASGEPEVVVDAVSVRTILMDNEAIRLLVVLKAQMHSVIDPRQEARRQAVPAQPREGAGPARPR